MAQQWDPDRYANEVGFVAALGEPLIDMLAPRAHERILDLGCGDGALTEKLVGLCREVVAVDSSPEQIEAARARGLTAEVVDGHRLTFDEAFDGVLSNAALHWMKRPDEVLIGVAQALKPGGRFVGEMGGYGNVATIVRGIERLLRARGIDPDAVNPWYFPTLDEYRTRLGKTGFEVTSIELFPRPTPLDVDIVAWLEIFTQSFFAPFSDADRATLLAELREDLRPDLFASAGRWTVDYVRLRFGAVKKEPR